jgi:hypothetical protein
MFLQSMNHPRTLPSHVADYARWQYIRMTANHYNNAAVEDPTSPAIRCFEDPTRKPSSVANLAAGSTIGIKSSNTMGHPGPVLWYMAKVPQGQSAANWKGDGNVWFKFQEKGAIIENSMVKFETGTLISCNVLRRSLLQTRNDEVVRQNTSIPSKRRIPSSGRTYRFAQARSPPTLRCLRPSKNFGR